MEKQRNWSATISVFLFSLLTSPIYCTSQRYFLNRMYQLNRDIDLASHTSQFNAVRRISILPPRTTISGVNQQELKEKDLIKNLPGQPPVSFKQYGGYVAINETAGRFFYYYFVEAIKANKSSPLVIWFNGGPACSSLEGAFDEHGPFRVHSDGKTLYRNPYSWNDETNVLYVESPAGVGFSYTNTPSDLTNLADKKTAEDNYVFLVKWLERFSEYKGRDFYITGESYAGHYCPQLAQLILHNKNQTFINLRGIFIGNPGLDNIAEMKGGVEYLFNHALISSKQWDNYKTCVEEQYQSPNIEDCMKLGLDIDKQISGINLYSIYSPICLNSTLTSEPKNYTTIHKSDPCSTDYLTAYLNRANVQEVMHANTTKRPYTWRICNDALYDKWGHDRATSMIPILKELIGNDIRVWVYSGDTDAKVSHTSTMDVLRNMNLTVEKVWRPWFSEGEVGGYIEEYKNKFTYATVRGAGHMVPRDQPIRALTLFTSFIQNTHLPDTI